jgi:hypothetical protein
MDDITGVIHCACDLPCKVHKGGTHTTEPCGQPAVETIAVPIRTLFKQMRARLGDGAVAHHFVRELEGKVRLTPLCAKCLKKERLLQAKEARLGL